jgi:Recombination endonuclease VII
VKDPRIARLKLFNLTIDLWDLIDAFQNHVCAVCKHPNKSGNRLSTDHSHITGLIRGLLCQRCNRLLGKIEHPMFWRENTIANLLALADYLAYPTAVKALGREIYTYPGKFGTKAHREWIKKYRGVSGASFGGTRDDGSSKGPATDRRVRVRRRKKADVEVLKLRTVGRRV